MSTNGSTRLRDYAFPIIGDMPVSDIATPDILKVLTPIWNVKAATARRVRQRLSTVLEWARAAGFRSGDNPVDLIGEALPRQKKIRAASCRPALCAKSRPLSEASRRPGRSHHQARLRVLDPDGRSHDRGAEGAVGRGRFPGQDLDDPRQ